MTRPTRAEWRRRFTPAVGLVALEVRHQVFGLGVACSVVPARAAVRRDLNALDRVLACKGHVTTVMSPGPSLRSPSGLLIHDLTCMAQQVGSDGLPLARRPGDAAVGGHDRALLSDWDRWLDTAFRSGLRPSGGREEAHSWDRAANHAASAWRPDSFRCKRRTRRHGTDPTTPSAGHPRRQAGRVALVAYQHDPLHRTATGISPRPHDQRTTEKVHDPRAALAQLVGLAGSTRFRSPCGSASISSTVIGPKPTPRGPRPDASSVRRTTAQCETAEVNAGRPRPGQ